MTVDFDKDPGIASRMARHQFSIFAAAISTLATALAPLTHAAAQDAQAPVPAGFRPSRFVVVDNSAYVVGDSELIAGSSLGGDPVFSPDGERLMVWQEQSATKTAGGGPASQVGATHNLICWSRQTRKPKIVWSYTLGPEQYVDIGAGAWLPDSRHYYVLVTERDLSDSDRSQPRLELVVVDAQQASARTVPLDATNVWSMVPSPTQNIFAVNASSESADSTTSTTNLMVFDSKGDVLQTFPLFSKPFIYPAFSNWINDTTLDVSWVETIQDAQGPSSVIRLNQLNLTTGKIVPQNSDEAIKPLPETPIPPQIPLLRIVNRILPAHDSDPELDSAYIESTSTAVPSKTLVAADAFGIKLVGDPKGKGAGVVYLSRGSLLFASLNRTDSASLKTGQKSQLHVETINRLMRISTALQAYARKHGSSPVGVTDLCPWLVGPDEFLKDDTSFRDPATGKVAFVYRFSGGLDPGIPTDQTIPIGYMDAAGGRYELTNKGVRFFDKTGRANIP